MHKTSKDKWNNLSATASRIGATNYQFMPGYEDATYSFDYGNSHFVGLDSLGSASGLTSAQLTWLDQDLTSAESRGLKHAFIFFHGPIYCVNGHCSCSTASGCSSDSASSNGKIIPTINKHPIVAATFHGHEHVEAYTHVDSSRVSIVTHPWEQFVTGGAGADLYDCTVVRSNYCAKEYGFVTLDVNGNTITVNFYKQGSTVSQKTVIFTHG